MPIINQRLFLRLCILVAAFAIGLHVVHAIQADRIPDALLRQAERATQDGKPDKAIAFTQHYLVFRPNDQQAIMRLGELMQERAKSSKELLSVVALYEKILREDPKQNEIRRKLVDLCIRLNRPVDAGIHAKPLLEADPHDSKTWVQVGQAELAVNKFNDARAAFEKAIHADPKNIRAHELLAYLLIKHLNQPLEAEKLIDEMVARNPKEPDVYLIRARYRRSINQLNESLEDIARLQELSANSPDALLLRAEVFQIRGEIHRARTILSEGAREFPKDQRFFRSLAWLEVNTGNANAAIATLEEGLQHNPGESELLTPLADMLIQRNEVARVEAMIQKLESRKAPANQTNYLKGRVAMQQGRWEDALFLFEPIRTEAVAMPVFAAQLSLLISMCHEHLGNPDKQMEAIQRILTIDPSHLAARVSLGNLFLNEGKLDEAIREYAIACKSPYALFHVQSLHLKLRLTKARRGELPPEGMRELGEQLNELREKYKSTPEPSILLAEWALLQGNPRNAVQLLREECSKKINDPSVWIALANLVSRVDGVIPAQEILDEAQSLIGSTLEFRLVRARLDAEESPDFFARRCETLLNQSTDLPEFERRRLAMGLADIAELLGERELERKLLLPVMAHSSTSTGALQSMLFRFQKVEYPERALVEKRFLEQGSTLTGAQLSLDALEQLRVGNPQEAKFLQVRSELNQLVRKLPDRADLRFVLAQMFAKSGDIEAAERQFQYAYEFDRGNTIYLREWLAQLLKRNDLTRVQQELTRLAGDPRFPTASFRSVLASTVEMMNPLQRQASLKALLEVAARDVHAFVLIGRRLDRLQSPSAARLAIELAVEKHPQNPDSWGALLQQFVREGNANQCLETLAQAKKTIQSPTGFLRAYVPVHREVVQLNGGREPLTTSDDRMNAQRIEVRLLLRRDDEAGAKKLLELASISGETPEQRTWANRERIVLLSRTDGPKPTTEVAVSIPSLPANSSIEEKRSQVTTLATLLQTADGNRRTSMLNEGVKLLQEITSDAKATDRDWFRLGQFYRLTNNRAGYRKTLGELIRREPENLYYLSAEVDELLVDGELAAAERQLPTLRKGIHDFRILGTVCRIYGLKDQSSEVNQLVEQYIQSAEAGTGDDVIRVRKAAELLDQLYRITAARNLKSTANLFTAATEKYRLTLRNDPDSLTAFSELLAHAKQVGPALELIQSMKGKVPPSTLVSAGMNTLRSGNANPRQFQVVREWIDTFEKTAAQPKLARLQLADWHALQQQFPEAEAAYRKVLESDPGNVIALNNLAWILAARTEQADEALKLIEKAIRAFGPSGELLDTRARILISQGSYELAEENLNEALGQSQTSLRYFHLALSKLKQSRKDEALRAFKEAKSRGLEVKQIHPGDLTTYKVLSSQIES